MRTVLALIRGILSGLVGWFLFRYPTQIGDFIFGKDPGQWRPMRFFKFFGIALMCLAGISALLALMRL